MNTYGNKRLGNTFESQLCDILFQHGFWVHNIAQTSAGQPADIIAVKHNEAFLIDCKTCLNGRFSLSRIEVNQDLAMTLWKFCDNGDGWFAISVDGDVFMVSHATIKILRDIKSYMSIDDIHRYGIALDDWISKYGRVDR